MGFWSAVGSFVSSACSAIAVGLSKLGSVLSTVSAVVELVSLALGVLKPGDDIDELGAKAMKTDKKPEDFDSVSDYINHLRNDVVLDKEGFKNASVAEKIERKAVGTAISIEGVKENKGFDIPLNAWVAMAKMGMDGKSGQEINLVLEAFKGNFDSLSKYTEGELNVKKETEVSSTLYDVYKEFEPNASEKEIKLKVLAMGG